MIDVTVKHKVIEKIQGLPVYKSNYSKTQHVVRCPYCGDSIDPTHGHFSIRIDESDDTPMLYRCLKCDASGLINDEVLEDLGVYIDDNMKRVLTSFNKNSKRKYKITEDAYEEYYVPIYNASYMNNLKLEYLNRRLGTDMDIEELKDLKGVLDIFEFMKFNKLESINGLSMKQLQFLNNNYVGFLSTNNNYITLRNITDKNYKRYYKMILNPRNLGGATFYSIPNSIDILYNHDIEIHAAEGYMDILSVYKNLVQTKEDNFYYGSCGFGFLTILRSIIKQGLNTGLNIHIYSDNDKTDYDHFKYLFKRSNVTEWVNTLKIHRNGFEHEKDYGVPKDRIVDTSRILQLVR